GMTPEEAARKLKGITCGRRSTSCPDQLALALEDYMAKQ
ncbi:MAG: TSCPD domain-containing protein, partial [Anaerotignum sp.]|nr:TSCPD domain-containing protein [Anaerotignum sp.]